MYEIIMYLINDQELVAPCKGISLIPSNPAILSNAAMPQRILPSPISTLHSSHGHKHVSLWFAQYTE